ncbi:GNAT family N-acetyltransferase [Candidatus Parcubacteria bacterium]|nr:MAG: GNAT family N-acetyltransferase [Candidatus Parcubacteria bacterium]
MDFKWFPLDRADVKDVDRIARQIHPTLPERVEVFEEKIRLFPEGCCKFVEAENIVGYGISHPWKLFSVPPLNQLIGSLPDNPDCIYIHDVAVLPEARGHNAAGSFVEIITKLARRMHIQKLSCVSVYGTEALWSRFGFQAASTETMGSKLNSYGNGTKYMIADLA